MNECSETYSTPEEASSFEVSKSTVHAAVRWLPQWPCFARIANAGLLMCLMISTSTAGGCEQQAATNAGPTGLPVSGGMGAMTQIAGGGGTTPRGGGAGGAAAIAGVSGATAGASGATAGASGAAAGSAAIAGAGGAAATGPTFTRVFTEVLAVCSSCHSPGGERPPADMILSTQADAYAALVNHAPSTTDFCKDFPAARVVPFKPDESLLVNKISSQMPACGNPMPFGGTLNEQQIMLVRDWIAAGAMNN